jgi:hypothetical protein
MIIPLVQCGRAGFFKKTPQARPVNAPYKTLSFGFRDQIIDEGGT